MAVVGGRNLQRILRQAGKGGVRNVEVGFFSDARYQDGTPVAAVAAWNEFGTSKIPSRPFIRNSNAKLKEQLPEILKNGIDPKKNVVEDVLANQIGLLAQATIQTEIRDLREPPNSPVTIELKGSDNPLIDDGKMRQSTSYKVNR